MKLERNFNVNTDEATARSRIIAYFTASGYMRIGNSSDLVFKRGSPLGMLYSFNPVKWKCEAKVLLQTGVNSLEVNVAYHVKNDPLEESITRAIWLDEITFLQKSILNNDFSLADTQVITRKVANNVLSVILMLVGVLLSGAIAIYLSSIFFNNLQLSQNLTILIGIVVFLALSIMVVTLWNRFRPKYQ